MNPPAAPCTIAILVLTILSSWHGFRDPGYREKYLFSVPEILAGKQYFRLFTSAFLHADWNHLLLNMVSLYVFGSTLEPFFGTGRFLLVYFAAIVGGGLLSLWIHRHHEYRAYGASGGVCGLVLSYVVLWPGGTIYLKLLFPMPAWLYAIAFLAGSVFALRRQTDNIGHDAHLGGAIIGLLTTAALEPWAVRHHPIIFLSLLVLSGLVFAYLIKNPLFLPLSVFLSDWRRRGPKSDPVPRHRNEALAVDAVLEKISKQGMESLTADEKALLKNTSAKYQRRANSRKPESDLLI